VLGCHDSAATPSQPPPAEVGVVTVTRAALPLSYEFVGEVQPIRRVEVRARVDGVIESRPFTEGSFVKAGRVLYRLERVRSDAA
jgi:membrane fusion protein (multidrug efflux system)